MRAYTETPVAIVFITKRLIKQYSNFYLCMVLALSFDNSDFVNNRSSFIKKKLGVEKNTKEKYIV